MLQPWPLRRKTLSASRRAGEQADAPDDDVASDAGADSDDDEDRRRRLGGGGGGGARAGAAGGGAPAAAAGGAGGDDMPDVQARCLRGGSAGTALAWSHGCGRAEHCTRHAPRPTALLRQR